MRPGKPGENGGCCGDKDWVASFFLDGVATWNPPSISIGASTSTKRLSDNDPLAPLTSSDLADADLFCSTMRVAQANSSIAFTAIAMVNTMNVKRVPPALLSPRRRPGPHTPEKTTSNTKEVAPTETNVLTSVRAVSKESFAPFVLQQMMHAQIPMMVLYDGNCGPTGSFDASTKNERQRRRYARILITGW